MQLHKPTTNLSKKEKRLWCSTPLFSLTVSNLLYRHSKLFDCLYKKMEEPDAFHQSKLDFSRQSCWICWLAPIWRTQQPDNIWPVIQLFLVVVTMTLFLWSYLAQQRPDSHGHHAPFWYLFRFRLRRLMSTLEWLDYTRFKTIRTPCKNVVV